MPPRETTEDKPKRQYKLSPRLLRIDAMRRREIADQIKLDIDAGMETKGRMPDWWLQVERYYRNEVPQNAGNMQVDAGVDDPGYPQWHVPMIQPTLDMLNAQVCSVVGRQEPVLTDTCDDEQLAENRQDLCHRVWMDAGFQKQLPKAGIMCGTKDLAIHRLCPGKTPGSMTWDVIDPENFIVFPAVPEGIQAAAIAAHRTNRRRRVIDAMVKRGEYYVPTSSIPAGDPAEHDMDMEQVHTGTNLNAVSPDSANELIELWDCVVRLDMDDDGEEKLYRATLDYVGVNLLALEPYNFTYIWYFRSFFIGSPKYFYSGMSVGRNLYPVQSAYDSAWSCWYGGNMSSAKPNVYGPEPTGGEKYTNAGFGDYIPVEAGTQLFSPNITFKGEGFPVMLGKLEQTADKIARISQNTQGAQATGQTTATEQSIIAAGVATGLEMYIANFTDDFPIMGEHTMEIIYEDYDAFSQRFGTEPEVTEGPVQPADIGSILTGALGGPPPPLVPPIPPEQPLPNQFPPPGVLPQMGGAAL
jgi:hypothetical protein